MKAACTAWCASLHSMRMTSVRPPSRWWKCCRCSHANEQVPLKPEDLDIQFAKSGGAGGQNVNKRETAVRITHVPTGISVHVSSERSQQANREKAEAFIKAKIFAKEEERRAGRGEGPFYRRNDGERMGQPDAFLYVLHPYKMVKDHEIGHESHDPERVLAGNLDEFIDAQLSSGQAGGG
jgi:peptide chain release factor 2